MTTFQRSTRTTIETIILDYDNLISTYKKIEKESGETSDRSYYFNQIKEMVQVPALLRSAGYNQTKWR